MPSNSALKPDGDRVPYAAPQVPFMQPDMVHSGVLRDWLEDDRMWVPQTAPPSVSSATLTPTSTSDSRSKAPPVLCNRCDEPSGKSLRDARGTRIR